MGMAEAGAWRAGFELEVVLGDLGLARFAEHADWGGMDRASPAYCMAVASALREYTGRDWAAPRTPPRRPGFYVIDEEGLDPINWPSDRVAGVELLTPPLPLGEADAVRNELIEAIFEIDGDFNFCTSPATDQCAWHINIDGGPGSHLLPSDYIVGVDELLLLARNDRLWSQYAAPQRHAVGIPLLRLLRDGREGALSMIALSNLLNEYAGHGKSFAANFAKLERGYLELRHFSAWSFFHGPPLVEQLDRIPAAFEVWFSQGGELELAFIAKLRVLSHWLEEFRSAITWDMPAPTAFSASGTVSFAGSVIADVHVNGSAEVHLRGRRQYHPAAVIRNVLLPDVAEAVALVALDVAELRMGGRKTLLAQNGKFAAAIRSLGCRLRSDPKLSSKAQLATIRQLEAERSTARDHANSRAAGVESTA